MSVTALRFSRLHKLIGLVIGLQVLFWTASGVFFTLFPIETIRGDPWRPAITHGNLDEMQTEVSAAQALTGIDAPVQSLTLKPFLNMPVWVIETSSGRQMVDATTGAVRSPLSGDDIDALRDRFGSAPEGLGTFTVRYLISENPLREYGGPLPAWVIEYEPRKQRIYVDAMTGDVRAVRTTRWRIFDILWRFHIMDFTGEDRIDSWWMKLASMLGLTLVLSGFVLLVDRARKGRLLG